MEKRLIVLFAGIFLIWGCSSANFGTQGSGGEDSSAYSKYFEAHDYLIPEAIEVYGSGKLDRVASRSDDGAEGVIDFEIFFNNVLQQPVSLTIEQIRFFKGEEETRLLENERQTTLKLHATERVLIPALHVPRMNRPFSLIVDFRLGGQAYSKSVTFHRMTKKAWAEKKKKVKRYIGVNVTP